MSAKKQPKPARREFDIPSLVEEIFKRIADGESLQAICRDAHMPVASAAWEWVNKTEELRERYARARESQAEKYAAEIVEIADTCADPNKARLQIDARKWFASKVHPKRYGDRMAVEAEHTGTIRVVLGGNAEESK